MCIRDRGTTYTISFYAKKLVGNGIFEMYDNTNSQTISSFNITDEWARYSGTFTPSNTSTLVYWLQQGSSGIYQTILLWGAQIEQQSYATSYIPTNGSIATRLADQATGSGNSSLINSTEGVLYAEIAALADDLTIRRISLSDGTNNNRINLSYTGTSNNINYLLGSGGTAQFSLNHIVSNITDNTKIALKWKLNDFAFYVDGVKVGSNTSAITPTGIDRLNFASPTTTDSFFHGNIKALAVYKEALTDAELQELTTI